MKICYITHNLPFGTYEAFVIPEIKYIMKAGHQVTVVPLRPESEIVHQDSNALLEFSLKQPLCNDEIIIAAMQEIGRNPVEVAKLIMRIGKSRNFWIFIKNLAVVPKALWLTRYLRKTGIPDHIHVHWINASATMAMVTASMLKIPWSITAHRGDIAVNNLIREKVNSCSFVRCINENGAKEIQNLIGRNDKIYVLHMGVEIPDEVDFAPRKSLDKDAIFKILMPANFVEVKGHVYLIQAIQLLQKQGEKVQLDLAGKGELELQIQQTVCQMGLSECVHFLGEVSHSILLEKLFSGEWNCVTLPSIVTDHGVKEGIPVSLIEAMAAGVPIVSTLTGGIPELCIEGTSLLVPDKNSKALCEAILSLMHDENKVISMIQLGKIQVKEHFNIGSIGSQLLERFRASSREYVE